jgi:uncharacterized protein
MQKNSDDKLLFAPTDLLKFLGCNYATFLEIQHTLEKEGTPKKVERSDSEKLISDKGLEHEDKYLAKLKQEFAKVIEIPKKPSLEKRVKLTIQAMQNGADVIYQAVFKDGNWTGDADFLLKVATPSNFGDFSFEALDTKLSRRTEPKHITQLSFYSELLGKLQGIAAAKMHLFLGDNKQESFIVSEYKTNYLNVKKSFESYIDKIPSKSYPEPCGACNSCSWKEHCTEIWERDDHLTLVANIQKTQIQKLQDAGIDTLEQLANTLETTKVPNLNPDVFTKLRMQASLQFAKRITGKNKYEILPDIDGKGI